MKTEGGVKRRKTESKTDNSDQWTDHESDGYSPMKSRTYDEHMIMRDVEKTVRSLVKQVDTSLRQEKWEEKKKGWAMKKAEKLEKSKSREVKKIEKEKLKQDKEKRKEERGKILEEVNSEREVVEAVAQTLNLNEFEQMKKEKDIKAMIKLLSSTCRKGHNHFCKHLQSKQCKKQKKLQEKQMSNTTSVIPPSAKVSTFSSPTKVIIDEEIGATVELTEEGVEVTEKDGFDISDSPIKQQEVKTEQTTYAEVNTATYPQLNAYADHNNYTESNGYLSEFTRFAAKTAAPDKPTPKKHRKKDPESKLMKQSKKLMNSLPRIMKRKDSTDKSRSILKSSLRPDVTVTSTSLIFTPPPTNGAFANSEQTVTQPKNVLAPPVLTSVTRTSYDSKLPGFNNLQNINKSNIVSNGSNNNNIISSTNSNVNSNTNSHFNVNSALTFRDLRLMNTQNQPQSFSEGQNNQKTYTELSNVAVKFILPQESEKTQRVFQNYSYEVADHQGPSVIAEPVEAPIYASLVTVTPSALTAAVEERPHLSKVTILRKSKVNFNGNEPGTHYYTSDQNQLSYNSNSEWLNFVQKASELPVPNQSIING